MYLFKKKKNAQFQKNCYVKNLLLENNTNKKKYETFK